MWRSGYKTVDFSIVVVRCIEVQVQRATKFARVEKQLYPGPSCVRLYTLKLPQSVWGKDRQFAPGSWTSLGSTVPQRPFFRHCPDCFLAAAESRPCGAVGPSHGQKLSPRLNPWPPYRPAALPLVFVPGVISRAGGAGAGADCRASTSVITNNANPESYCRLRGFYGHFSEGRNKLPPVLSTCSTFLFFLLDQVKC